MANKSLSRNTKKKPRPLGRVVGGVYVINTKKSSERGRPRRRPQRDARLTSPRGRIPVVDPLAKMVGRSVFPCDQWAPNDPRWKSKNLGHLIDTPLGWVADLGGCIPLLGPVCGPVLRGVCRGVRTLEDGINWGTSYAGLTFFLICLLSFGVSPAESIPAVRYEGKVGPGGNYSRLFLTNCCPPSSVRYCSMHTCIHDAGCAICEGLDDGNVSCWVPDGIFASHPPHYQGVDPWLTHHIEVVSATLLACDWLELGEFCAGLVWIIDFSMGRLWHSINIVQNATCWLQRPTGIDPGVLSWIGWIKSEVQVVAFAVQWVMKVPVAMLHLVTNMHYITLCSFLYYMVSGNPIKVAVIFFVYVESAAAAPTEYASRNCSWFATYAETMVACSPLVQPCYCSHLNLAANVTDVVCFNPFPVETKTIGSYIELPPKPWGCIIKFENNTAKCCAGRRVPAYCKGCASDCSWRDPRQTYEVCGTTPWASTSFDLNGGIVPTMVLAGDNIPAILGIKGDWRPYQTQWPPARNRLLNLKYNNTWSRDPSVTPGQWARIPGVPESYRSWWIWVPVGYYADARDISTGYITKDTKYPDYQLVMSATGALSLTAVTTKVLIAGLMALLGGKWTLMLYCVTQLVQETWAFPECLVAAACASTYEHWLLRILVFFLVWKTDGNLWWCLTRHPKVFAVLVLLNLIQGSHAQSLGEVLDAQAFFGFGVAIFLYLAIACQAGLFASYLPRLALLRGYLSQRIENVIEQHSDSLKEFLLISVIFWPGLVLELSVIILCMWFAVVTVLSVTIAVITPTAYPAVCNALNKAAKIGGRVGEITQKIIIFCAGERGAFFYQHLGQELPLMPRVRESLVTSDPYSHIKTECIVLEDKARKLACGDSVKHLPVSARLGTLVLAGCCPTPPGWEKAAPFTLQKGVSRGELRSWCVSLLGLDRTSWSGSIFIVGTALRGWMGFTSGGLFHTALHGCRGRRIATHRGPLGPYSVDTDRDYATYPAPAGCDDLEPCCCSPTHAWLPTRIGTVVPVVKHRDPELWTVTSPLPINVAKGSSGAPLLCSAGHVIGMFVSGMTARGTIFKIRVKEVMTGATSTVRPQSDLETPPTVPKEEQTIRMMVAPTGSGKSTKLPAHYVKEGYSVLVLNPSVATTLNFPKYMKDTYGISPNIRSGEVTITTGSKLTYSTYGRWLASDVSICNQDVIICDECHATDPTTILGLGRLLEQAPHLRAKLIILATATPPGTPTTPHPNIEEVELTKEGDIPFHGKALKLDELKRGRHLIFQASKNHCDALAQDLNERGLRAVAYYRGLDVSVIPNSGDVVVVATDALMTGYTGNFDSVTDCCLSVEPHVSIDMDPTFTISVRTLPSSNVCRMQRRGRTGRGKKGIYRYVSSQATMSGRVPEANVVEAFDAGVAWFGLTPQEILAALDTYKQTPGLPCPVGNLQDWAALYSMLTWVTPASVARAKKMADNYALLTAAQMDICKEHRCDPPSEDPRWAGLIRYGKPPEVLFHLDGPNADVGTDPELCEQIRACFADHDHEFSAGGIALGLGFGVAAATVAFDLMGAFSVRCCWKVVLGASTIEAQAPPAYLGDVLELEECVSVPWDAVTQIRDRMATALSPLAQRVVDMANNSTLLPLDPEARQAWAGLVADCLPAVLSAVQYGAGLLTLGDNPVLASAMAFTSGFLAPMDVSAKVFLSILGGAFAAKLGTTRAAMAFVGAGLIGSLTAAGGMGAILASLLSGYASATAVCVVVYKLLCREMPTGSEWLGLLTALLNPGAGIAGAAVAALAFHLTTPGPDHWPNRLLAMLTRGNVLPDEYFLKSKDLRRDLSAFFSKLTVWQVCVRLSDYLNAPTEADCARTPPRALIAEWWQAVCKVFRCCYEFCLGTAKRMFPIPGVPLFSCQKPYVGRWYGSGMITARCPCGAEGTWLVEHGTAKPVGVSRKCRAWWGGVPINNSYVGNPRPAPTDWTEAIALTGFNNYLKFKKSNDKIYLVAVSDPTVKITGFVPKVGGCSMVDGMRTDPWSGDPKTPWTGAVNFRGEQTPLPICLTDYLAKEKDPPKPGTSKHILTHLETLKPDVLQEVSDIANKLAGIKNSKAPFWIIEQKDNTPEGVSEQITKVLEATGLGDQAELSATYVAAKRDLETVAAKLEKASSEINEKIEKSSMVSVDSGSTTSSVEREAADLERKVALARDKALLEEMGGPPPRDAGPQPDPELVRAVIPPLKDGPTYFAELRAKEEEVEGKKEWWGTAPEDLTVVAKYNVKLKPEPPAALTYVSDSSSSTSVGTKKKSKKKKPVSKPPSETPVFESEERKSPDPELPDDWVQNETVRKSYRAFTGAAWPSTVTYKDPVQKDLETRVVEQQLRAEAPEFVPIDSQPPTMEWDGYEQGSAITKSSSGSWETISGERKCSRSYVWQGARILAARVVQKTNSATAVLTKGLMKFRNLPYVTDPAAVVERCEKVTFDRHAITPPEYLEAVSKARKAASKLKCSMWDLEEIGKHTPARSAKSLVSGLTAADVRSGNAKCRITVGEVIEHVKRGKLPRPFAEVVVVPKTEVFVKTPKKPTMKPPRIIAYPHLEMRCAEKAFLGDVAQRVAKAVLGPAYGFQYNPQQRVKYLLDCWRSLKAPFGFTFDTRCFDSTVTPDDMAVEASIFTAAQMSEEQKQGILTISRDLYQSSVMVNIRGQDVGVRNCRASGTYTTSAGNTITCFLKASAAAKMAGLRNPKFLIHGDDCLVLAESDCPAIDARKVSRFAAGMKAMGCPPGDVPAPRYSLEALDTCSSNVTVATTNKSKPFYFLTRDPSIPLARASCEGVGYNPTGSWIGYLVANYPALWASRILAVHLCDILLHTDLPDVLEFDWYGNKWAVPVKDLPEIIAALHGPEAFDVRTYTPYEVSRVSAALKDLGFAPLRVWRKKARIVRGECIRRGGAMRRLATRLLWFAGREQPTLDAETIARYADFQIFDVYSDPSNICIPSKQSIWRGRFIRASLVMGSLFVALILIRAFTG
ncbi:polyprotein [Longquan Rhinolophus pusillus hepacivirus 1]|nr:polyprotein [Longquan Rhinolophus pusillus hepacivirus 1]